MAPYRVLITREVLALAKPGWRERQRLMNFLETLADDPFQEGDFQEKDDDGRTVEVKILGQYAVTFWADHALKEVKVTKMVKADME